MRILSCLPVATAVALSSLGATAHAMGAYHTPELIAWSADGGAALVRETLTTSGTAGVRTSYAILSADREPVDATFDSTLDPDRAQQHVTAAECRAQARTFAAELAARGFRGVTIEPARCQAAHDRDVVHTSAAQDRATAASWLPALPDGPARPAELDALLAAAPVTVARGAGSLFIVLYGENGDDSAPARVAVVRATAHGYVLR